MNKIFKQIKSSTNIQILILFAISVLFVLFFSTTTSPLYLSNPYWHHGDSGIFQEMGLVIAHGGTPYVDVFDHKGPVLFFIQAIGLMINEFWGIFVLQCLSLFITLYVWYKTIRLFNRDFGFTIVGLLVALIFLFGYYQRGNMCEEWSLPLISIPIFVLVKHLFEGSEMLNRNWLWIGLCTGTVIFIRANNIAPILGFAIFAVLREIKESPKMVVPHILCGLLGCVIVALFWILLFYLHYGEEALSWMMYGTFLFNFEYIQKGIDLGLWHNIWYYVSIICFVALTFALFPSAKRDIIVPLLFSYLISAFAIGTNKNIHYITIFIPLFLISFALIQSFRWFHVVLMMFALIQSIDIGKSGVDVFAVRLFKDTPLRASNNDFKRFVASVSEKEQNSIYNLYALPTFYFAEEKLVQVNRCVLKGHWDNSSRIQDIEKVDGIIQKQPEWILLGSDISHLDREVRKYICDNYAKMDSIIGYDDVGYVYCYKKQFCQ